MLYFRINIRQIEKILNLKHLLNLFRVFFGFESNLKYTYHTSETPHVNGKSVGHSEYYFRRPVEPGLNVGIDAVTLEAT